MKVEGPEGIGITADTQKIRPGMIYVDLSCRRNRRKIYEAYEKGASLIFTPYNISDPNLPVIKVESPRNTLYMLFEGLFRNQKNQAKLVGIFGESDKSVLVELMQGIFGRKCEDKIAADIIPISIDANAGSFLYQNMNFDCVILTDRIALGKGQEGPKIPGLISRLSGSGAVIINNDEFNGIIDAKSSPGSGVITYGLNKRAVVTASSINVDEVTCFNYCVRKSFQTSKGTMIEPFETPIRLNTLGSNNMYNALAAITCGLYYSKDIADIKASAESYKAPFRHFQKVYDGDFVIIDNYCGSVYDYAAAFDSIQILNYGNLMLIVSVSQDNNPDLHEEKARLITEWGKILKCKEVILTSCMDNACCAGELPLKSLRAYKRVFKENSIAFRYYHSLHNAIEKSLSIIGRNDLMVMLGSDEMRNAQRILSGYLRSINDRKN